MQRKNVLPAAAIRAEYEESAVLPDEHQKVKWASEKSMLSRFELAAEALPFSTAKTWLDVGCGPGSFQAIVRNRFPQIACVGLDISPTLIAHASGRTDTQGCVFMAGDFLDCSLPMFDLITCIGVLQRTNFSAKEFFIKVSGLLRPGGRLFLDTKNANWEEFTSGRLIPDPHLQWFTLDSLTQAAINAGLHPIRALGFDPHHGEIVPEARSATIFLVAEQKQD